MTRILFLIILLFTNSCASNLQELSALENKLKLDNFYSSYLALEYLNYSRSLYGEYNWQDAEYFAKKGLQTARGSKVLPESPIFWNVSSIEAEDAILAQKRLENVSNYEIQKLLPIQMSHLTFLYDCWINKEPKPPYRLREMSKCKERFYKLLEEVEHYSEDLKKDRQPKTNITELEFEHFEIFFDLSNAVFNDAANKKMLEVLDYLKTLNGDYRLLLIGNADRTGNELYNQNLALRRIQVVQNYLIKNGVPDNLIETRALGEDFPDIITKKGVQQQLNRTAGIYVLKGIKNSFANYPMPLVENYVYQQEVQKARKKRGL